VGQPFASGSELTLENGYAALYRGSAGGLNPTAAWLKFGETGGLHTGADVGPVGDLNGDGRGDFAVATRDESSPDGLLRGRVTYFLGHSNTVSIAETFRTWGANAIAKSRCDSTNCCVSKNDFNLDGFTDALTFSWLAHALSKDMEALAEPARYSSRQRRTADSIFSSVAAETLPAGGPAKRVGSRERNWKQRKTVSIVKPLSDAGTRTLVG
jgi:hypothetical protein